MKRTSTVVWKGSGKEGSGEISTSSRVLDKTHYAWNTRFENEQGTNPEELLGAAHAACFTMKLSFLLGAKGFTPDSIKTTAEVTLEKEEISHSHLHVTATVPGISNQQFIECAEDAKTNCLVSKALKVIITMDASLTDKTEPVG
jgi:osmotically inducible protein OsmC